MSLLIVCIILKSNLKIWIKIILEFNKIIFKKFILTKMQYNHFKILIGVFILLILIIVLIVVAVNANNGENDDSSSDECSHDTDFTHSIGPLSSFEAPECKKSSSETVDFSDKCKKPYKNYKK